MAQVLRTCMGSRLALVISVLLPTSTGPTQLASGLIFAGSTLYGTAHYGGTYSNGTVFSLLLGSVGAPQLIITLSAGNVLLTWPTNATGFTLQSTTNLASPAVWTSVFPAPFIVNGLDSVTNPIFGKQKFYRLSQ